MESDEEHKSPPIELDVTRASSDERLSDMSKEIYEFSFTIGTPSTFDNVDVLYDTNKSLTKEQIEKCDKWIKWFCSVEGHEFLCKVNPNMLEKYNFYEFRQLQRRHTYNRAMGIITGFKELILEKNSEELQKLTTLSDFNQLYVLSAENIKFLTGATQMYGIIHSFYVLTAAGQHEIHERFMAGEYGKCRRVLCLGQPLMPVGIEDKIQLYAVKLYCSSCYQVYEPEIDNCLDGYYFGTGLPDLFFMNFPELRPILLTEYKFDESEQPEEPKIYQEIQIHPPIVQVSQEQQIPVGEAAQCVIREEQSQYLSPMAEESSHSGPSSPVSIATYYSKSSSSRTSSSRTSSSRTSSSGTSSSVTSTSTKSSIVSALTPVEPMVVEQFSVESAPVRPMSTESVPVGPMSTESVPVGPMSTESVPVEPMSTESVPVGPMSADSVSTGPLSTGSVPVGPSSTESVSVGQMSGESVSVGQMSGESVSVGPMSADSMSAIIRPPQYFQPNKPIIINDEKLFKNKTEKEKAIDFDSEIKKGLAVRVYDDDEYFVESKKDWFCTGALTAYYRIDTADVEEYFQQQKEEQEAEIKLVSRRTHSMSIDDELITPQKRQRLDVVDVEENV